MAKRRKKPTPKKASSPAAEKKQAPKASRKAKSSGGPFWMQQGMIQKIMYSAVLFILAYVLYSNTHEHEYVLDDPIFVSGNAHVNKGYAGLGDIFGHGSLHGGNGHNEYSSPYRPIPLATYALEREWFKNADRNTPPQDLEKTRAHRSHKFNTFYYALCVLALFWMLQQMFPKLHLLFPLAVALLFCCHPIHTEVVANVKSRDEILNFLFLCLSLGFFLRYARFERWPALAWGGLTLFLALISKEMAVTFLLIIPLALFLFSDLPWKKIGLASLPAFGAVAAYFLIRMAVLDPASEAPELQEKIINNSLMAADGWLATKLSAIVIVWHYLRLLFVPFPLSFDYSYNQIPVVGAGDWQGWVVLLLILGLVGWAIYRLPKKDPLAFPVLYFFITLSIVSNLLVPIGATLGERFLFTPSLAFCLLIPLVLTKVLKVDAVHFQGEAVKIFGGIILVVCGAFSFMTIDRNADWKTNQALFEAGVEAAPNSTRTWSSLATTHRQIGENPNNPPEVRNAANAKAVEYYKKSIEILPSNDEAWYNLGVTYLTMLDTTQAIEAFENTLEHDSTYANALNNLGVVYFTRKQYDQAENYFTRITQLDLKTMGKTDRLTTWAMANRNLGASNYNQALNENSIVYLLKSLEFYDEVDAEELNQKIIGERKNVITLLRDNYRAVGNLAEAQKYQALLQNSPLPAN